MLLEVDGIAEDDSSDWLGEMGDFSQEDVPEPFRRLLNHNGFYDASGMGAGDDATPSEEAEEEEEEVYQGTIVEEDDGAIVVRKMSMAQFREKLIGHFNICFQRKELAWPKQRLAGTKEPTIE
jgi:hypothetical protein